MATKIDDPRSDIEKSYEAGRGTHLGNAEDIAAKREQDQREAFDRDFGGENYEKDGVSGDLSGGPKNAEENPVKPAGQDNSLNYTGGNNRGDNKTSNTKKFFNKAVKFAKKRGGIIGIVAVLGVGGGGLMVGLFGPASLLISLTENFTLTNDTSSVAMERRLLKVFGFMTADGGGDAICANKSNIKCKMGKISNKALRDLNKKGITAIFEGGTPQSKRYTDKRMGYPEKNPSHYEFDIGDGSPKRIVASADLEGFLKNSNNKQYANLALGKRGAFNMRVKAWTGNYIKKKFFNVFNIRKSGGAADGTNKRMSASERLNDIRQKVNSKLATAIDSNATTANLKNKLSGVMNKARKGGVGYTAAVGACAISKTPSLVGATVAAVQVAQLIPFAMDYALSPGDKFKSSYMLDNEDGPTSEDADTVGTFFTEKARDSNGNMTSALDSAVLLSVMGINKGRPAVSKFAPGFSLLSSSLFSQFREIEKEAEPICNVVMSPTAMYSAIATDSAVTMVLSSTVVGALLKIAAGWAISELIQTVVVSVATSEMTQRAIIELAENKEIENVAGSDRGDVIGPAVQNVFAAGGSAHHLSNASMADIDDVITAQKESEKMQRQMDIASLSPFDTSSRYTFLGSIVYNTQMAAVTSSSYNIGSLMSSMFRLPSFIANAEAAVENNKDYYSYAEDFGLDTGDPKTTPAITNSGTPVPALNNKQANMTTQKAIDLLIREGWLCDSETEDCPDIPESADIDDLINIGYIRPDNLLYEFIETCSTSISSGNYFFNASGCIATGESGSSSSLDISGITPPSDLEETADIDGVKDPDSIQAISVFLNDFKLIQALNGEDEVRDSTSSVSFEGDTSLYYQYEEPWRGMAFGHSRIGPHGCGPTTLASVVSSFYPNNPVNPKEMADYFVSLGGQMANGGSYWVWHDRADQFRSRFGISVEKVQPSAANAIRGIQEGGLVVISTGSGSSNVTPFTNVGHILMIRGMNGERFLVGDPASRSRSENAEGFAARDFHFGVSNGTKAMWIVKKAVT